MLLNIQAYIRTIPNTLKQESRGTRKMDLRMKDEAEGGKKKTKIRKSSSRTNSKNLPSFTFKSYS